MMNYAEHEVDERKIIQIFRPKYYPEDLGVNEVAVR
jgi:hypothetical protein